LIAALEEFTAIKKFREERLKDLRVKVAAGGVKGMTAKNEMDQIDREDPTTMNRLAITLNAAKKRAAKMRVSDETLAEQRKIQQDEEKRLKEESRARLSKRLSAFEGNFVYLSSGLSLQVLLDWLNFHLINASR
jgi:Fe-S cluster assembly iron-binding protein IscA